MFKIAAESKFNFFARSVLFLTSASALPKKLAKNLYVEKEKSKQITFMRTKYPEHYEMLCQKGIYPYDWVDNIKKLDHK